MRNRYSLALSLILGSALLVAPLIAQAGGTIKGKVTFSGKVPPFKSTGSANKVFDIGKFPNSVFCSKNAKARNIKIVPDEEKGKGAKKATGERLVPGIEVDKNKGLKSVVVAVRSINDKDWVKKGYKRTEVFAKLCEFHPFTGVAVNRKSKSFYVENTDNDPMLPAGKNGVLHNPVTKAMLGVKQQPIFNIALPSKGKSLFKKINKRPLRIPKKINRKKPVGFVRLQCDQHEFMQNYFLVVNNPFYAKVNDEGMFEIKDVPGGKHTVLAWHPLAGNVYADVEVKDGETVEVNFDMKKK